VEVIDLDRAIAGVAATVGQPGLRTLDAIHLATAISLLPDLDAFVTYDDRLAQAARTIGLPVLRPA
jgi:predicted nucleic acid-binding protein